MITMKKLVFNVDEYTVTLQRIGGPEGLHVGFDGPDACDSILFRNGDSDLFTTEAVAWLHEKGIVEASEQSDVRRIIHVWLALN